MKLEKYLRTPSYIAFFKGYGWEEYFLSDGDDDDNNSNVYINIILFLLVEIGESICSNKNPIGSNFR